MKYPILTNKLIIEPCYDNITKDFVIVAFSSSEKYIKYGAKILDSIADEIKVKAIVFESGRVFYGLFDKELFSSRDIIKILNKEEFSTLSIREISPSELPKNILAQLFINSLNNYNNPDLIFNNITGKLLCSRSSWYVRKKNKKGEETIKQLPCLNIKIDKTNCLSFSLCTFTSLTEKEKPCFKKKKITQYAVYDISAYAMLKRVEYKENAKGFIQKQYPNKKNRIKLIDFASYESFLASKCGVIFEVFEILQKKFNKYIKVNFKSIDEYDEIKYDFKMEKVEDIKKKEILLSYDLQIVDMVNNDASLEMCKTVAESLEKIGIFVKIAEEISFAKMNIVLIHNKEYYDKYETLEDTHLPDNSLGVIQHITYEDFVFDSNFVINSILNELAIKKDIEQGRITTFDWNSVGKEITFLKRIDKNKIGEIAIKKDGLFSARLIDQTEAVFNDNENGVSCLIEEEADNEVEAVFEIDGSYFSILTTQFITLPQFNLIGKELFNESEFESIETERVINSISELLKERTNSSNKKNLENIKIGLERQNKEILFKRDVLTITKNKNIKKLLYNKIYEIYGILIKAYLRSSESRQLLFGSNLNIKFFREDASVYYFVGEKSEGINTSFPVASNIRKIVSQDGMEVDTELIGQLLCVDFVRNEQLTVLPFPVKYLREATK